MLLEDWEEFAVAAIDLCKASPNSTRLLHKYRHADGKLVLKVTDGPTVYLVDIYIRQCFKFNTDKAQDLKRLDRLNKSLMAILMDVPEPVTITPEASTVTLDSAVSAVPESNSKKKRKKKK